jgi:hypothetical protein
VSQRLLVVIVLIAVAVGLLVVSTMGDPPDISNNQTTPPRWFHCVELRRLIGKANQDYDRPAMETLNERYDRECPDDGRTEGPLPPGTSNLAP